MMKVLSIFLAAVLEFIPAGQAFLRQIQPRDSILVADQLEYGVRLDGVTEKTSVALPDFSKASNDTITIVRNWQVDSLADGRKIGARALSRWIRKGKPWSLEARLVIAPFEEGVFRLPDIPVVRGEGGRSDTLLFTGCEMDVRVMPIDTATFVPHDIKGQIEYPVTFGEVLPYVLAFIALVALVLLIVYLVRRSAAGRAAEASKDPAHIVALRELDRYRGDKYWAPEKQKAFYSGITDTLKTYIDARFGVDAPEMTTAELFAALKSGRDLSPELYGETKALFERADFVKFAKYVASDKENEEALPLAVRFVTDTYQSEIGSEEGRQ